MPSLAEPILNELREEVPATRRVLEKVPAEKLGWRPHQKSRSLGELAAHMAAIPSLAEKIIKADEFSPGATIPATPTSTDEILATFDRNVRSAQELLRNLNDEAAQGIWRVTFKGKEVLRKTRVAALRTNLLNHMYHHRGQLSVYLRLLDVPVPMVYGPTADENPFA